MTLQSARWTEIDRTNTTNLFTIIQNIAMSFHSFITRSHLGHRLLHSRASVPAILPSSLTPDERGAIMHVAVVPARRRCLLRKLRVDFAEYRARRRCLLRKLR
eukprot:751294-Hanusia_phi.AAC.2